MWKAASLASAEALGAEDGAVDADADGAADATASDREGVDGGGGSGANATIPASSNPATTTPTTSPATIDKRGHMAGGYQYGRATAYPGSHCYDARPMTFLADRIRTRIVPALLTALGVTFLAAGLLSYTNPVTADPLATPSPSADVVVAATPSPLITLPPLGSGGPASAIPSIPPDRVVTRVRVAALKIDLPVIREPGVPCGVALEYLHPALGQPGQGRATYLYAHAQAGMFLSILDASKVSNGIKMKGMVIEIWTSDDQRFLYAITSVLRHVKFDKAFDGAFAATTDQIWLQTSEGKGTQPKLQVVGELLSQEAAAHADANPVPHPHDPTNVNGREVC